jgi:1,2-diacylglycerol 3-beta-glucosyltransferase
VRFEVRLRRHPPLHPYRYVRPVAIVPALLTLPVGYLCTVTAAAVWARVRGQHRTTTRKCPTTRFAVLIPAHDEELVIADTLESVTALDYPPEKYSVFVIADHCRDRTVEVAARFPVDVLEHVDPEPAGKGPSLQWAIDTVVLAPAEFDAVVVIDADTVVSPNLLSIFDARLARGAHAVQAYYTVRDPHLSTGTTLRSAALALRHYLRPSGRTALGLSSGLYGNGMALTTDIVSSYRWSGQLTEDLEFQTELVLGGIAVDFAPDATVSAEMPLEALATRTQNERWERGRIELARRYLPRLIDSSRRGSRRQRLLALDTALDHLVPPLSVLALATATGTIISLLVPRSRSSRLVRAWMLLLSGGLSLHVLIGLKLTDAPREVYWALLKAPSSVAWKVALWARMLTCGRHVEWARTGRNVRRPV